MCSSYSTDREITMLKLHYTGPKPLINQHGVFFKTGKIDKYLYLPIAIGILKMIDTQEREPTPHAVAIPHRSAFSNSTMLETLQHYEPELAQHVQKEEKAYEKHIDAMITLVENRHSLTEEEKEIWIRNIRIMTPYMIQREINKLYYIHTLKHIKHLICHNNVTEITTDFELRHWHVMRSISGNLEYGTKSTSTSIRVESNREGKRIVKLLINLC